MPLVGKTLRGTGVSERPDPGLSLLTQVVYVQSTDSAAGVGRRQVNPAAPGSPGDPGLAAGAPRRDRRTIPHNVPPRATLTGDPQRLCNTHLSPRLRCPGSGARTT